MKKRLLRRIVSMCLVVAMITCNVATAYANDSATKVTNDNSVRTGVQYVIQCSEYDSQCGNYFIDGELVKTVDLATLHDGIMQTLDGDAVINTNDCLGNSVISNEKDTYSTNMYNANAGTVNLTDTIVAESTIGFGASTVRGEGAILYSKNGDINFYCSDVDFTGVIYAPNGIVNLQGSNININGVIIAKKVVVRAGSFKVNYNKSVADMVDMLDYTEIDKICGLSVAYNDETSKNVLQWDDAESVASVDIYARYDESGFKQIATVTGSEYEITQAGDYQVLVSTKYGEKIASNVVTLVSDEEGFLYEDTIDTDGDGLSDGYEYLIGTDIKAADTDNDGFEDGYEVFVLNSNPLSADADKDSDGDGVTDLGEVKLRTNPYLKDSDFDGLDDGMDEEPNKTDVNIGKEVDYTVPVNKGEFDLITRYVDEEGNKCELIYNYLNGQIKYMSDSNNVSYNVYNADNQLTAAIEQVDGNIINNTYSYVGENVETITHNGFQYSFAYDEEGNLVDVKVGNRTLITNKYENQQLVSEQYGNGYNNTFVYDNNGNVIAQKSNDSVVYEWTYDENGNAIKYKDVAALLEYAYAYDEGGNLTEIKGSNGFTIAYKQEGNVYSVSYTHAGIAKNQSTEEIKVETESNTEKTTTTNLISGGKLVTVVSGEDSALRTIYNNDNALLSMKYTYSDAGISKIEYHDGKILEYVYDGAGNISEVKENGELKLSYEYDSLGQLTRENNKYSNKSYKYTYDTAGNMLKTEQYAYTIGELSEPTSSNVYGYEDSNWKDLLTSFNGQTITYDTIGNPLTYRDNMSFAWSGRQLQTIKNGTDEISYTYNSEGIRISKTVNGVKTTYQLEGAKIVSETTNGSVIWYIYDENDMPVGFEYNSKVYYFNKNAQGDIIEIIDEDGKVISEYVYDAWGNVERITGDAELAKINPFRYRGYYQDNETGFYYLQSRYYDAEIGRFVNADIILGMGNNLYTYCNNNPVNSADYMGYFGTPIQWICAVVGGIAGWYFGDYIAKKLGLFDGKWYQWQTYAYWAVRGLVVVGGSIIGYVAGTKLLSMITTYVRNNPNLLNKLPAVAKWFLGLGGANQMANEMYARYASHIFSADHIKNGIMKLGANKSVIFDKIFKVVTSNIKYAENGSNQIHTYINGYKVTVRFYFKDGELKSLDAFMGWASRVIGNLIK